ncbi:DM13 domain-containing protein [Pseudarthrobacter chlorophenolicus]|uniref:DM13 domain-containing protein n=1 Tax=Pseudarthrobacter chlorophenolicus TaxID=85085 RepID=UPI001F1592F6|nr:DM13 domain-containing protein [Pseudarthrobacter chlorophenolicus]
MTLQGQFQSQGATTTGTATIRVTESGAALQLEDFATGPGDSIRLMLSPGTLRPGPTGKPELSSSTLIELGPLRLDRTGSQRIDLEPGRWESMPEPVRSVVIYNYAGRVAYGTANLFEAPPS